MDTIAEIAATVASVLASAEILRNWFINRKR